MLHAAGFDPVTGSQHPPPAARFSSSCASIPVPRPPISHYPCDNECRPPPAWAPPEASAPSPPFASALTPPPPYESPESPQALKLSPTEPSSWHPVPSAHQCG